MNLCTNGAFELGDPCVRNAWATILPAALVLVLCVSSVPLPATSQRLVATLTAPIRPFLTLAEAEALDAGSAAGDDTGDARKVPVPLWRAVVLSGIALAEALVWTAVGSFRIAAQPNATWDSVGPFVLALPWFYAVLRPITHPKPTPSYRLFALYLAELVAAVLVLGGRLYDSRLDAVRLPFATVLPDILHLAAITTLLAVVLATPIGVPSRRVSKDEVGKSISPEDYTSLWGWISFAWVSPLVASGRSKTLNEPDVWKLSPTMQARPVYTKFSATKRATLLRRLWAANAHDIILDFVLTFTSVVFNYLGPFFLKRILDAVGEGAPEERRSRAYIFAVLAFLATLLKAEADVQHLWLGRRAAVHIRSELMSAIYEKALKRRDFSGIVDKDKGKKVEKGKEDDPRAGADVGKIVNLMSADANRCGNMISGAYFIYGAPFEILIGSVFLYQLLGASAFAGFLVLLAGWPLNSFISRRSIRIQKGVLAARDKRMGVLNELMVALKFIKFFAWEDRWIERVLAAREVEMQWMVKARVNSVMFSALWTCAPILVSLVSFLTYVASGHELTVSTAFTAIALFNMIRQPLNVIPAWIVQILQTGVALNRISTFLDEDEVTAQVSSLKVDGASGLREAIPEGLGLDHATFKWNEVEAKDDKLGKHSPAASGDDADTAVETQSANADLEDHRFELRDVSILFPEGKLTLVTGPTASGKTALLMSLLGELTLVEGRLIMAKDPSQVDEHGLMHTISYAAQSPWLRHQSIKDNILFGYPYDEARYDEVVECCALRPDLDILEDGDATEIGARGVSLSGGQKARVALARAVYAHTKYVLLDDPLSAVDSHTARLLFDRLLCGPLLAHRTVILVTHHVELVLPGSHYLVRMLDGRIDTQGSIKDLRARGVLDQIALTEEIAASQEAPAIAEATAEEGDLAEVAVEAESVAKPVRKAKKPRKLVKDEARETGSVKWNIYRTYLKASSYLTWVILAVLILCGQSLGVTEKFWIRAWGNAYAEPSTSTLTFTSFATPEHEVSMDPHVMTHHLLNNFGHLQSYQPMPAASIELPDVHKHPMFYVGIYSGIGLATAFVGVTSVITQYTGALRASRLLFRQLLVAVVRATMRWHDVTPQGRIMNRFSRDIETVDSSLASSLQAVNSSLATFFASIITISVIFPFFLIPATAIGFVYYELAIGYLNTGRDLRRMESNSRSPLFSGFGELLEGIVTVRAFSAEKRFLNGLFGMVDLTTQMWYSFWMMNRWLLLRFDALGALAVFVTTLFAISARDSGLAGICITSAMAFTSGVYWACRFWTALELDLNSVERVVEYLDLPQEPPAVIESNRVPAYWPSSSSKNPLIRVEDLVIKYAPDLPPVLHGVSFELSAKERIGLLGRTGSGKSTLAMSILRFVDPASGRIVIDGIDISTIGVHDLRSRLTFIPQDATLFSGTLRENLDPFDEHTDAECLDVLLRVRMISESTSQSRRSSRQPSRASSRQSSRASSLPDESRSPSPAETETEAKTTVSLTTQVSPGGSNFSQGQRQLIAMARALLRRSSIIVLDEATSSIDFATDAQIQATIREEFNESLLLTVAHRLKTVIDYDRLIVLDKGTVAEFDTPFNLIRKEDGIFRNMCLKSGTFAELEAAARAKAGVL